ncbi:glycosyltransferase family 4 protein [Thioclava atlantica]|uniref:Glycosyltransferase n=1 Tax=Thioclava atlantica TaxID=1317124 RepID=A0A085TXX5_9RHOB|nr:glycosyltransferase family 4 protein [Thioclava atlantica]KFE35572.1 glycosyltransferase [Thioclava atlantica]
MPNHSPSTAASARPIKVLHVCETAMGGVGTYQRNLVGMEGVEQRFLVPSCHREMFDGIGGVLSYLMTRRGAPGSLAMIRHLLKTVAEDRPDIVMAHSTLALLALAALRLRHPALPSIYCPHGWAAASYAPGSLGALTIRRLEGRLSGVADRVVNVSEHDLQLARSLGYRGTHIVIENAVPPPVPDASAARFVEAREALHLLFVGRFDRQKGLDILLEAFAMARESRPDLHLHLIGAPVRGGSAPNLAPGVTRIGWVRPDEIDSWYRSADALVVPSRWEGLPLVIPEALRNGTPVLAARRSGMERLISEGRSGFSFDLRAENLARLLSRLEKTQLNAMRPACAALYRSRFAIERLHEEMGALYRQLV